MLICFPASQFAGLQVSTVLECSYLWFTFLLKETGLFDIADHGDHLKPFLKPFKYVHLKGGLFPPGVYTSVSQQGGSVKTELWGSTLL